MNKVLIAGLMIISLSACNGEDMFPSPIHTQIVSELSEQQKEIRMLAKLVAQYREDSIMLHTLSNGRTVEDSINALSAKIQDLEVKEVDTCK